MKIGVKVGDIMTRNFYSISPEASLQECAKEMVKRKVGSLVLKEGTKLKGLLTERDIIWAMTKKGQHDLSRIKAKEVTSRKTITIKPQADLYDALQKMRKTKYRWLPVTVNSDVIGLLTLKDILRVEPGLFEVATSHIQIREESDKRRRMADSVRGASREGICEECGNYDMLYNIDGKLICESCKDAM